VSTVSGYLDGKTTDPDVEYDLERRGQQTSVTRETVEEMIAAALNRQTVVRIEAEKALLGQYQNKIAFLERERDEALERIQNLEEDLQEVTMAENKAKVVRDDAMTHLSLKQKEVDDMLAIMEVKEAKVAHLESQLAKIHSLSKTDATIASNTARPDSVCPGYQTDLASHENLPQTGGWGDATAEHSVDSAADIW